MTKSQRIYLMSTILCPYQFVYKDIVSNVRRKFENYCNEILN